MKKDLAAKNLLNCPDVFADIGNVNLFGGRQVVKESGLERLPQELVYRNRQGDLGEHRMDTRMKVREENVDVVIFCAENQAAVSNTMPVRDMGYLYSSYSEQIREKNRADYVDGSGVNPVRGLADGQKLVPVVSLVLYWGKEKWTGPTELKDMLALPEWAEDDWMPLVQNHRIRLVRLREQGEEIRRLYQSDFRHVVDYLAYEDDRKKRREYMNDVTRKVRHPEEYLDMMSAFTTDKRFSQIKERVMMDFVEGDEVSMVSIAEELMEEGIEKGIERGQKLAKYELVCRMLSHEQTPEMISAITEEPLEYIYDVQRQYLQTAHEKTAYSAEKGMEG